MGVIVLECETKEPVIIGDRQVKNIYLSANSIPPTTVRGAIYHKILIENCHSNRVDDCDDKLPRELKNEIRDPTIIFGPIKLIQGNNLSRIAHIFTYKDKLKEDRIFSTLKENIEELVKSDDIENLIGLIPDMKESYPKTIGGAHIIDEGDQLKTVSLEKWAYINVRIDEEKRSTIKDGERGALYSYEAIQPGLKFTQNLYIKEKTLENLVVEKLGCETGNFDIYLGRGITRGFGRTECKMKIRSMDEILNNLPNYYIEENTVIAVAQTPIFELDINNIERNGVSSKPYIEQIEKHINNYNIAIRLKYYNASNRVTWGSQKIPGAFIIKGTIKSWAFLHGPRPKIEAAYPGSLFVYKTPDSSVEIEKVLKYIEITGANSLSRLGYNHLEFLKESDLK